MRSFVAIFTLLFAISLAQSQYRDAGPSLPTDTLATVGPKVITSRDLVERIELMPWQGKGKPGQMDSAKIRALQSLAAEAILSMEAAAQGVVDDSSFRMHSRNVEKLMVRDELYKREVRAKVALTPGEIRQGLKRFARQVTALMINTGSESEAAQITKSLKNGARPDSLARARRLLIDTANVKFGMLEKSQEDAVYGLTASKPVSDPVNVPRLGWVVLYLLESSTDPQYAKLSPGERQRTVMEKLTRRKEMARADTYVANELSSHRAEVKPTTFKLLAATLRDLFAEDSVLYRNQSGYRLDKVVTAAEERLKTILNDPLVDLEGKPLTVLDVLETWRNYNFLVPSLQKEDFYLRVNGAIREVVEREFLSREGFQQKLEQTEPVRHDVDTWMNAWLASSLARRLVSGINVTDQEVMDYLVSHADAVRDDYLVNVRELLSDSLSTSLSMLERVVRGEDFKKLCETYTRREGRGAPPKAPARQRSGGDAPPAQRGGESGYFSVSRRPEIGFLALDSDTGKVLGPVKTKDGYSIFTVLGKEQRPGRNAVSYDSLKSLVKSQLLTDKAHARLDEYVASAAKNYPVTLYYDRLAQLKVSPVNLVTKRFIGFGGTMPATPGLLPVYNWVDKATSVKQVFP